MGETLSTAKLQLSGHSGTILFDGYTDFAFLPQPGQMLDFTYHPRRKNFPAIEQDGPVFAVVSVVWGFDQTKEEMIPFIHATYGLGDQDVLRDQIYQENPLLYPFFQDGALGVAEHGTFPPVC